MKFARLNNRITLTRLKQLALTLLISAALSISISAPAQQVVINDPQLTLHQLFETIETQTNSRFVLSEEEVKTKILVSLPTGSYQLADLLEQVGGKMDLKFNLVEDYYVVVPSTESEELVVQNVRGLVLDQETGEPLIAATVYLKEYPLKSTITDMDGKFLIQAPIGRANLTISYVGYKEVSMPLLLNTGEEPYFTLTLEPSVARLKEFSVVAERDKSKTQNNMAYAGSRGFTVLEANRYAGTLGDPARMARSFAGVVPARDDRNDIIIRGNSPTGIQWRLDDIEIPNPNHYGGIGLTGNTTTLLNMNLLQNSDFLMGAFPTEYGNALAGVFDLHTKKINPTKRQYRFQSGWNGLELGAEGPFSLKNPFGTYSLTYRYSFLDVVDAIGVDFGVLPQFQDITGKFDFKLGKNTDLSLLGIWGTSYIELDDRKLDLDELPEVGEYLRTGSDIALGGINIKHRFNKKLSFKGNVSVIDNQVKTNIDTFNFISDASNRVFNDNSGEVKYALFSQLEYRNNGHNLRTGIRWDTYAINYNSTSINEFGSHDTLHSTSAYLNLARVFIEDEYRFTDRFRARIGVHAQHFLYNGSTAVEPRLGLRYYASDKNVFAFGYGNHHMLQPRTIYFVKTPGLPSSALSNKNLDFSAAHHLNLAHNYTINSNLRIKSEAYFQYLYDIPVESNPSSFSMVNVGADFYIPQNDSLVNQGLGRNYGVELTLERFLDKGYYFMLNGTVFKSEYQTLDNKWRSTAFDMRYTVNALAGYERWFGQMVAFGADARLTYAGGRPFTTVNEQASLIAKEVIFNEDQAFASRFEPYFRTDIKVYYRINYKNVYTEFAVDFQNLTNHQNVYQKQFNVETGEYETFYHMSFFPMFTFKLTF